MLKPVVRQVGGMFFCRHSWTRLQGQGLTVFQAYANWIYRNLPWGRR